jgi:hypothetical protein
MVNALKQLPDDVKSLKILVADQAVLNEQLQADKHTVLHKNEQLKSQLLILQEQLNLALAKRYAASSERKGSKRKGSNLDLTY